MQVKSYLDVAGSYEMASKWVATAINFPFTSIGEINPLIRSPLILTNPTEHPSRTFVRFCWWLLLYPGDAFWNRWTPCVRAIPDWWYRHEHKVARSSQDLVQWLGSPLFRSRFITVGHLEGVPQPYLGDFMKRGYWSLTNWDDPPSTSCK